MGPSKTPEPSQPDDKPSDPTPPETPDETVNPDEPIDPAKPDQPHDDPTDPSVTPPKVTDTEKTVEPTVPGGSASSGQYIPLARTGTSSIAMALLCVLFVIGGAIILRSRQGIGTYRGR
ncbi:MAG: hypothetical protein Q4P66_02600 [Actinomycetaceae bacterium]|nr:hypothetical protein [Actinomycetaceae bacterium]